MGRAALRGVHGAAAIAAVLLVVADLAGGADADAVRRAVADMLSASRTMVDHGERRDVVRMGADADRVVAAGEQALAALPQPGNRHARDAADHLRRAMDHARAVVEAADRGQVDDALAHARKTLSQVRRGAGHAGAL
jgi:hypothetical protein